MTVFLEPFASVYDDRSRLGVILARGRGGFEAYAADDHSLGLFPSPRKAAAAITTTRPWTAQTTAEDSANGANNDCSRAGADKVRPRDQSRDRQKTRPACADEGDRMCKAPSGKAGAALQGVSPMGHRLITALIVLNVMGFLACVALIAAAISKDDAVVLAQVTYAILVSVRMFVVGAAVPTVAWGIAALEFDRSHSTKRSLASATMYALLVVSLILFCVAGWRLPRAFLDSLQITVEFNDGL